MNLVQEKKHKAYHKLEKFFKEYGDGMAKEDNAIAGLKTEFNSRYAVMKARILDINKKIKKNSISNKRFRDDCVESIWKLVLAMKYHFHATNDESGMEIVNVSRTGLRLMSNSSFFTFCQTVLDLYKPKIYKPLSINDEEIKALKLKLPSKPDKLKLSRDTRIKRTESFDELTDLQRSMDYFIKNRVAPVIDSLGTTFSKQKEEFLSAINLGNSVTTSGKPHKAGHPAVGKIHILDKAPFRKKLTIIVSNLGHSTLLVGRSEKKTEIQGTPFTIEPGRTRMRNNQKLGSKGDYLLIQNVGDEEGSYEMWLKE